jgi:hypothetical protein
VREKWIPELTHPRPSHDGVPLPGIRNRARAQVNRILTEHEPEPLDAAAKAEMQKILAAAAQELASHGSH